jgi:hypothetical protein
LNRWVNLQHRFPAVTYIAAALDRIENVLVKVAVVEHHGMGAVVAAALGEAVVKALARALLALTVITAHTPPQNTHTQQQQQQQQQQHK